MYKNIVRFLPNYPKNFSFFFIYLQNMEQTQNSNILAHKIDRYQSATLSLDNFNGDLEQFNKILDETMAHLRNVIFSTIIILI